MIAEIGTIFTEVLAWLGQFVAALVTETGALHDLLPLLFIGVCISLVMVGVKIVRKIMWGN